VVASASHPPQTETRTDVHERYFRGALYFLIVQRSICLILNLLVCVGLVSFFLNIGLVVSNYFSGLKDFGNENVGPSGGEEVRAPLPVVRDTLYDDAMLYGYVIYACPHIVFL
jgi:hypothetical protein